LASVCRANVNRGSGCLRTWKNKPRGGGESEAGMLSEPAGKADRKCEHTLHRAMDLRHHATRVTASTTGRSSDDVANMVQVSSGLDATAGSCATGDP
jgi:hypothetical protein